VQHVFNWTREALLLPLPPGSVVIAISSGAAVNGSPLSGGYAGAKATIQFIASYAAGESARNGLGIRFTSVLPQLTPETGLGAAAVAAYAARQGIGIPAFLDRLGPALTQSRWAPRSSTLSPAPPMTATHTCSPPPASARCRDALLHRPHQRHAQVRRIPIADPGLLTRGSAMTTRGPAGEPRVGSTR
jgi:hypothetical protein